MLSNLDAETRARVDARSRGEHRTFVEGLLRNDILSTLSAARKAGIIKRGVVEKLVKGIAGVRRGAVRSAEFRDRIDGTSGSERREFHHWSMNTCACLLWTMQQSQTCRSL